MFYYIKESSDNNSFGFWYMYAEHSFLMGSLSGQVVFAAHRTWDAFAKVTNTSVGIASVQTFCGLV
jgi:hypothetical protein